MGWRWTVAFDQWKMSSWGLEEPVQENFVVLGREEVSGFAVVMTADELNENGLEETKIH